MTAPLRPEYVLVQRLAAAPAVAALVSDRIMAAPRPQSGPYAGLPVIVYQRSSPGRTFAEHGGPAGLAIPRVQFSVFDSNPARAWDVAYAAIAALDGWADRSASPPIQGVTCEEPLGTYEEDTRLHHVFFDAVVRYAR